MTYTAVEVQDALENLTWTEYYPVYKRSETPNAWGVRNYAKDDKGALIVERTEEYTQEFSWSEAENMVGHVYDVLGGVEVVASDPGGEGHGENIYTVVRVNETGQLFRIDGYYASYGDGSVYDGHLRPVNAIERMVMVYE